MQQLPLLAVDKSYFQAVSGTRIEELMESNFLIVPSAYYYEIFKDDHAKRGHASKRARFRRIDIHSAVREELWTGRPTIESRSPEGRVNPITYDPMWAPDPENEERLKLYERHVLAPKLDLWRQLVSEEGSWFSEDVLMASRKSKNPLAFLCDSLREARNSDWVRAFSSKIYPNVPSNFDDRFLGFYEVVSSALQSVLVRQHWKTASSLINEEILLHDTLDTEYLALGLFIGRMATNDKKIARRFRYLRPGAELLTKDVKI